MKLVERSELAPGWVVDEPVLCIGGRNPLDEAAAAMLAGVLKKRGLGAKALPPEAISAAHIASLAQTEAKLVALSLLDLGNGPAVIRYIVRRLRRILPKGTAILVCLWSEGEAPASLKAVLETAEADAYATTLPEAVEICIAFAKGEHAKKKEVDGCRACAYRREAHDRRARRARAEIRDRARRPLKKPRRRAARSSRLPRENHRPLLREVVGGDERRDRRARSWRRL